MADHLIILLGAGASYACTSEQISGRRHYFRPPLTSELFEDRFGSILHEYRLAEAAAADIRPAVAAEPVALEAFLRDTLRDSPHPHRRQQFRAVPLYLQHLLFEISSWTYGDEGHGYTPNPDNYQRLISAALDLPEAIFITLNYDTLLDRRLFAYDPLEDMNSYIKPARNWSLIKLHGSVEWGYQVLNHWERLDDDPFLAETFARIEGDIALEQDPVLRLQASIEGARAEGMAPSFGGRLFYPALSAPLGPGDELVCPPTHVDWLKQRLQAHDGLNLLVIGYSGLDEEVLKILRDSENSLRSLWVVSHNENAAMRTAGAITHAIGMGGSQPQIFTEGFDSFAQGDSLNSVMGLLP